MNKDASLLIQQQVPEFVVNSSPQFIEFMKAYYDFMNEYTQDVESFRDVYDTSDQLLKLLRNEFASRFPGARINDRQLIRVVREIYKTKGTISALELLFRIFFDTSIIVYEPGRQLLRASDSKWERLQSMTFRTKFGALPLDDSITIKPSGSNITSLFVDTVKIDQVGPAIYKVYFRYKNTVYPEPIEFDYYSGSTLVWKGVLVKDVAGFTVLDGGSSWSLGEVIRFPGTEKDSILTVDQISSTGAIQNVNTVEFGGFHSENQQFIVSPFIKPVNATFDIISTIVGFDPGSGTYIYDHQISLDDYVPSIGESVTGYSDALTELSYVAPDYVGAGYLAEVVLSVKFTQATNDVLSQLQSVVTIEEWLDSRAVIVCNYDYVTSYKGKYLAEDGQLSNPSIRLQDSYFYQVFSYVIQSTIPVSEYQSILASIHPAGFKNFGELLQSSLIDVSNQLELYRTVSRDRLLENDLVDIFEELVRTFNKFPTGVAVTITELANLQITLRPAHAVTSTDSTPLLTVAKTSDDDPIYVAEQVTTIGVGLFPPDELQTVADDTPTLNVGSFQNDQIVPTDLPELGVGVQIDSGVSSITVDDSAGVIIDYTKFENDAVEIAEAIDQIYISIGVFLNDEPIATDEAPVLGFSQQIAPDSATIDFSIALGINTTISSGASTATADDGSLAFTAGIVVTPDTTTVDDLITSMVVGIGITLDDTQIVTDDAPVFNLSTTAADSFTPGDSAALGINTTVDSGISTATMDDNSSTINVTRIEYNDADYFAEDYVSETITLSIG